MNLCEPVQDVFGSPTSEVNFQDPVLITGVNSVYLIVDEFLQ